MPTKHALTKKDRWFLDRSLVDPITKEAFHEGDLIVICANCKTVHLDVTWGMDSKKCCANCGHNVPLSFGIFSPRIFQPKPSRMRGFHIKPPHLPFFARIQWMDVYPFVRGVSMSLLLLSTVLLFLNLGSAFFVSPVSFGENWAERTEAFTMQLSEGISNKASHILENCGAIDLTGKGIRIYENCAALVSETDRNLAGFPADVKEKAVEVAGKILSPVSRLQSVWNSIKWKLVSFVENMDGQ